ncbi:hypothetical protein [Helicobacter cinaedi]|uniref:hypothetical protein n=1 Tax=Helicobacter cinaedi TaxID=213 RepID=UPI000E20B8D2|nr:hypothetical protein [Helicobacter cinaedi]
MGGKNETKTNPQGRSICDRQKKQDSKILQTSQPAQETTSRGSIFEIESPILAKKTTLKRSKKCNHKTLD